MWRMDKYLRKLDVSWRWRGCAKLLLRCPRHGSACALAPTLQPLPAAQDVAPPAHPPPPLQAALVVADRHQSLQITGNGDVLEPHDGVIAIGSGSPYALAAARALIDLPDMDALAVGEAGVWGGSNLNGGAEGCRWLGLSLVCGKPAAAPHLPGPQLVLFCSACGWKCACRLHAHASARPCTKLPSALPASKEPHTSAPDCRATLPQAAPANSRLPLLPCGPPPPPCSPEGHAHRL